MEIREEARYRDFEYSLQIDRQTHRQTNNYEGDEDSYGIKSYIFYLFLVIV